MAKRSNKSAEAPEGVLNEAVLKSFMAISDDQNGNVNLSLHARPVRLDVFADVYHSPSGPEAMSASPTTGILATLQMSTDLHTPQATSSTSPPDIPTSLSPAATKAKSTPSNPYPSPPLPTVPTLQPPSRQIHGVSEQHLHLRSCLL